MRRSLTPLNASAHVHVQTFKRGMTDAKINTSGAYASYIRGHGSIDNLDFRPPTQSAIAFHNGNLSATRVILAIHNRGSARTRRCHVGRNLLAL